jgi:glycosyltransferase involved in cell wall biosynthesis
MFRGFFYIISSFLRPLFMSKTLVIQIPCFNEAQTIAGTLKDLPVQVPGIDRIIILVVDDGSSDNTARVALENGADYVVRHLQNRGLAAAFTTGIRTALALGADVIVNTDADNQYPGRYIPGLISPILDGSANIVIGDRQADKNVHFSALKRSLEVFGSRVMRFVSQTDAPDAPSGFRAYARYAALRLQVFNNYSYTLETLIQAGVEHMAIAHLPIETNPTLRPSRLHKGIFNFIWRQSGTILRSYVLYQPLKTFILVGAPFLAASAVLILRFLFFYFTDQSGVGRYIQSVSIGGTLGLAGLLLMLLGVLGDAIRANRRIMEEILIQQRDKTVLTEPFAEFNGCPILKGSKTTGSR